MARRPPVTPRDANLAFKERLSALQQRARDYLGSGGATVKLPTKLVIHGASRPGGVDGRPVGFEVQRDVLKKGGEAGEIVARGHKLLQQLQGRGGVTTKGGQTSGFALRNRMSSDAVKLLNDLTGGQYTAAVKQFKRDVGVPFNSMRDRRKERQLGRDARVAESAAAQRNALARRRNMQLTPGSASELNLRAKSLFAERRRGAIY